MIQGGLYHLVLLEWDEDIFSLFYSILLESKRLTFIIIIIIIITDPAHGSKEPFSFPRGREEGNASKTCCCYYGDSNGNDDHLLALLALSLLSSPLAFAYSLHLGWSVFHGRKTNCQEPSGTMRSSPSLGGVLSPMSIYVYKIKNKNRNEQLLLPVA